MSQHIRTWYQRGATNGGIVPITFGAVVFPPLLLIVLRAFNHWTRQPQGSLLAGFS